MKVRRILLKVHLIIGIAAAPVLAILGLTGALLVFENPLDYALNRRLLQVSSAGPRLSPGELSTRLEMTMPGYRVAALTIPGDDTQAWWVSLSSSGGSPRNLLVDPADGRVVGNASDLRGTLRGIHQFHTRLLAGPAGRALVGWGGVALVLLAVTGLALWWPGKILRVTTTGTRRRLVFELHSALGGVTWLLLLLLGFTGIGVHWNQPALVGLARLLGEEPPAPFPKHAPGCDSLPQLPLGGMITSAMAAVPGARPTAAYLDDGGAPVRVVFKFPEDHTPAGRTNVFLAPCSGKVLEVRSSRAAPLSYRALAIWNREIHTGDFWGWPTRILATVVSLSLPVMALTGPMIWWSRRRKRTA